MSRERQSVSASLEVGFPSGVLPAQLERYRGRAVRAIPLMASFPFEDAQFDVVLMDGAALLPTSVREAHRVLRTGGRLVFCVPERTGSQAGYTPDELYALVREGYHITELERPRWWFLRRKNRTLFVVAEKKMWRSYRRLGKESAR